MEKLKKTLKNDESDSSAIQDRLNQMRRQQPEIAEPLQSERPRNGNGRISTGAQPKVAEGDEDFLRRFEEQIHEKPSYAQTTADILREQAEDRRKRMKLNSSNGVHHNGVAIQHPAPAIKPSVPDPNEQSDGFPEMGSILHLSDGQVVVFNKNVPSRNYQLVHMINADGTLGSQGIYLSGYQYEQIGKLSQGVLTEMQQGLTWDRDVLVFHLNNFHNVSLLPKPAAPVIPKIGVGSQNHPATAETENEIKNLALPRNAAEPPRSPNCPAASVAETIEQTHEEPSGPPAENEQPEQGLFRGRRFKISMGRNRIWEAVYWGKDQQGTVIAHNTNGQWALMHLDLDRFASSMELNGQLADQELREVENALREHYS